MLRSDKRRIDYRSIRVTRSYTVGQLAKHVKRTVGTVNDWIAQGLPTIDTAQPTMIYGWAAKQWLRDKWDDRRSVCGQREIYCFKCAEPHLPKSGSVTIVKRGAALVAKAHCEACGTPAYRGVPVEKAVEMMALFGSTRNEESGFNETDISTSKEGELAETEGAALGEETGGPKFVSQADGSTRTKRQTEEPILPANPRNERDKREFFEFLHHSKGRNALSIRKDEIALLKYEKFERFANFAAFNRAKAMGFKDSLLKSDLSSATIVRTLKSLQEFLSWLSSQPKFLRSFNTADIAYLNLPPRERRRSRRAYSRAVPNLEAITATLRSMPTETGLQKRNRALVAFCALTAIRETALIGLKLRHFDPDRLLIHQDPRDVRTKFGKEIHTYLIPLDSEHLKIFQDWLDYLRNVLGFSPEDPIFPRTGPVAGSSTFGERALTKFHHTDAQMLRRAVGEAFKQAGYPAYTPHSFRHMQMSEAYKRGFTIEEIKAISQNLGHSNTATTFSSYGKLPLAQQGQILTDAVNENSTDEDMDKIDQLLARLVKRRGDRR